jgi:hypothetical protein
MILVLMGAMSVATSLNWGYRNQKGAGYILQKTGESDGT